MHARRLMFIAMLALAGCGEKPPPAEPKGEPDAAKVAPAPPAVVLPPAPKEEPKPKPKEEPVPVPVSPQDKARVEAAEKKGAAVYDAQNGGYEIRIERDTDADAVLALLEGTKCIVGMSVEGGKLTDAGLRHAGGFDFLERLTLHDCPNVTGTGFDAFANLTRLKSVAISECPIADAACKHISRVKSLEEVRFARVKLTDAGLRELSVLPALELLALEQTAVGGSAFAAKGWAKLRDLDAPGSPIDDAGLQTIAALPAFDNLRLDSVKITDAGAAQLSRANRLSELSLANARLTDAALTALARLESLRVLDVSHTAITGAGFAKFPTRPGLRKLSASGTKFDDTGAAHLAKFPNLTTLALANCPVSDAGLTVLKEMKQLAKCDLSGTKAGDATAAILGAIPSLEDANFARTPLTDTGLKALAMAPRIRFIDARGTRATKEGAERAKMGRQRVEIRVE